MMMMMAVSLMLDYHIGETSTQVSNTIEANAPIVRKMIIVKTTVPTTSASNTSHNGPTGHLLIANPSPRQESDSKKPRVIPAQESLLFNAQQLRYSTAGTTSVLINAGKPYQPNTLLRNQYNAVNPYISSSATRIKLATPTFLGKPLPQSIRQTGAPLRLSNSPKTLRITTETGGTITDGVAATTAPHSYQTYNSNVSEPTSHLIKYRTSTVVQPTITSQPAAIASNCVKVISSKTKPSKRNIASKKVTDPGYISSIAASLAAARLTTPSPIYITPTNTLSSIHPKLVIQSIDGRLITPAVATTTTTRLVTTPARLLPTATPGVNTRFIAPASAVIDMNPANFNLKLPIPNLRQRKVVTPPPARKSFVTLAPRQSGYTVLKPIRQPRAPRHNRPTHISQLSGSERKGTS